MRRGTRLGLLFAAVTIAATTQFASTRADAPSDRSDPSAAARGTSDHEHRSAALPLSHAARTVRAVGNAVAGSPATASTLVALAAGWLLLVARRRDRAPLLLVAFRRRGPPFLPVVA